MGKMLLGLGWVLAMLVPGVPPGIGQKEAAMGFAITSPRFESNGEIPVKYTCEGEDVSPELKWTGAPLQAKSLLLIVDDPDAPDPKAPQRTWVHWLVYNLPPRSTGLAEAAPLASLPLGARQGLNDWQRPSYGGPCPPVGRHRYFFKLYALGIELPRLERATKADLESAMKGHVLATAELVGTYQKKKK